MSKKCAICEAKILDDEVICKNCIDEFTSTLCGRCSSLRCLSAPKDILNCVRILSCSGNEEVID